MYVCMYAICVKHAKRKSMYLDRNTCLCATTCTITQEIVWVKPVAVNVEFFMQSVVVRFICKDIVFQLSISLHRRSIFIFQ
jgi:hypothetical protein